MFASQPQMWIARNENETVLPDCGMESWTGVYGETPGAAREPAPNANHGRPISASHLSLSDIDNNVYVSLLSLGQAYFDDVSNVG